MKKLYPTIGKKSFCYVILIIILHQQYKVIILWDI